MEAITASSIDIAVPGAPLTIRRDDKVIAFTDVVREEMSSRPDGYWATQVDVRGVNYTVQVTPNQRIDTLASLFSSAAKKGDLHVLRDINFSLLPFETTVLLGRPRSGKTSLLDVLGFRRRGSIEGSVTVNGAPNVANYHRLVSYIQQGDVHLPMLTAKETLAFSANCQLDDRTKVDRKVDEVLQLLSLKHAENTIVGSDVVRGLSGGEKRRVSIGVEMVKESSLVLLDEPTTGLDSGAAYQVGQAMRALSARGTPVLAALLQPSWELVKLFDKVIVLSEGEIGYWGPVSEALSYFDSLGYSCPAHYSAAEFLAEVVDYPDRFPMDPERPRTAHTRAELIAAYRASDMHARMLAQAKASAERMNAEKKTHQDFQLSSVTEATHAAKYPRSRWEQFDLLLRRGFRNYARDWRREVESIVAMFVVSVITGLLFLQRGDGSSGSVSKLGLIFLLVLRGAFEALAGIVNLFIALPTFYRQRAGHYHAVLPWVLSSFCVGVPAMVVQSVAYPTIVYWMAGLRPDAGAYFFLIATCIVITLCFVAYVRIWGCLLPDPFMSALVATVTSGILIVFSGYLIHRARMPAAWRWVYFLSPFSYAFNAAAISEFAGADIKCRASELMPPADTLNFLAAYPVGYEGRQVCPFSDGNDFLAQSGLYTDKRLQGVFFLISVVWMCVFIALFYVVIRFVDYSDFRMTTGKDDVSRKLAPADAKLKGSAHAAMLSWENLTYTVPVKGGQKTILSNVHGYVKPGMLLALMGASGAGKTTLLDVLAQRKNVGKVTGTVLLDGRAPDEAFRRLVGYVEQTDMHFAQQTVLEALSFAAECRLPSNITAEQRRVIVTNVLDLLNLRSIAGAYIGYGGQAGGINAEERKRLSMGVELVAQPAILFLDEPTSGLDSNAADVVMSAIQNVAQSGTSVICTIHQPSSRIFNRATHLLLLKKGGQVVYFGEVDSAHGTLLAYMERHGVRPTPGQNPADLVLAASLGKAGRTEDEMLNAFVESPEARHVLDTIHEVAAHPPQPSPEYARLLTELRKSYATSFGREFVLHLRRWLMNYWRGPLDVLVAVVRAVTLGFICGTVYWNRPMDALGVAERFSVLFFSSLYADLTAFAYLPMVFFQRPIFYRERSERMYRTATYALGYIVADLPMMFLGTLCFTITFYFFTGLQRTIGHFAFYLLMSQLNTMVSVMYVQLIGSIFAKSDTGGVIYGSASLILATAAGFLIPQRDIPKVVRWISRISFSSYFIQSVAISEFTGSTYHCAADSALYVPINDTVTMPYCDVAVRGPLEILSIDSNVQWVGVGALAGFYVLFAVAYILCLQFINHVKR